MKVIVSLLFVFQGLVAIAQVVPDLIAGDHYLPYLSEQQKQEEIFKPRKAYPNTSEELYPHLYKYTHRDYLAPLKGTSADPANVFPNYSQSGFQKQVATAVGSPSLYNLQSSIEQRNRGEIEADMAAYESRKIESQRIVNEAMKELDRPIVNYQLGIHNGPLADRFSQAYSELTNML